ncbi:MAG: hypothetical protein PHS30_05550 [Bacteroidales bacterium]|nr:hypothetical protein [Bacteroidales bacterium]
MSLNKGNVSTFFAGLFAFLLSSSVFAAAFDDGGVLAASALSVQGWMTASLVPAIGVIGGMALIIAAVIAGYKHLKRVF